MSSIPSINQKVNPNMKHSEKIPSPLIYKLLPECRIGKACLVPSPLTCRLLPECRIGKAYLVPSPLAGYDMHTSSESLDWQGFLIPSPLAGEG